MLSGLGKPRTSSRVRHPVVAGAFPPGVGENFHNHVLAGPMYEAREIVPPPNAEPVGEARCSWLRKPGLPAPDLQRCGSSTCPFDVIVGQDHPNTVSILPGVVRPQSRGWIRAGERRFRWETLINRTILATPPTWKRMVQGVKLAPRRSPGRQAFEAWNKQELSPGPRTPKTEQQLPDFVRAALRQLPPSGRLRAGWASTTCPSSTRAAPSTASTLRCGRRERDAGGLPSGNCHAAIRPVIAERAADFVKEANPCLKPGRHPNRGVLMESGLLRTRDLLLSAPVRRGRARRSTP